MGQTVAAVLGAAPACPSDCSANGTTSCVATPSYTAAATLGLAGKVLLAEVVAGISGTVVGRPLDCASDDDMGCVATAAFESPLLLGQSSVGKRSLAIMSSSCGPLKHNHLNIKVKIGPLK